MNRRHYLAMAVPLLAGCSSAASETDPDPDTVADVALESEDLRAEDADVSLEIAYSARIDRELSPGDQATLADDGEKWLIVRMDVTNTGDVKRDLEVAQYVVTAAGETYEVVHFDEHFLRGMAPGAGETVTGWVAFSIPEDMTEATLTAAQDLQDRLDVTFTRDTSLSAAFPDE
ncbi:DUF4352 domain-containing protein [Natrinema salifodinae]|uniref:DUF4352 domain-containing protein n=1 Tax=Natrinema salifodinae TaxID=1202768 RepID=A0A1I0P8A0_9EURY|nr:DUF4352 domain-containing protein [Natrinema salifodinae]SEW10279.1 protein of unknown function [Natrinema salifodinae]